MRIELGSRLPTLQNRIRLLRMEQGWSQAELGQRLNVSRQTINSIETGKYDPSLPLAFEISRLFRLPIERIFTPERRGGATP